MMECERTDCLFNIDDKCTRQNKEDMTALEKWKNDFKGFISELSMPRDDYNGIMEYIDEVPNEASEQQPYKDWHDVPSDEMTLEQARQAAKDLRKKLVEYLRQEPCDDCISRSDVKKYLSAPDANGDRVIYESDLDLLPSVTPQPCEDAISRQAVIKLLSYDWANRPAHKAVESIRNLPPVTPKEKTGHWKEVYAETDYRDGWIEFSCENCEYQHGLESGQYGWSYGAPIPWKYCPICGAKMVEPQESEG